MGSFIDLKGQIFGRLAVLRREGRNARRQITWLCMCSCGKETVVPSAALRSGNTRSCGCLNRDVVLTVNVTHGKGGAGGKQHPLYTSWMHLKGRCDTPSCKDYKDYGGRGISYTEKWKSFEGFEEDMGPTWEEGLSLDRIDVNGNYCKENCRWATPTEQANNKRSNHYITHNNRTQSLAEWCRDLNLPYDRTKQRLNACKWSVEKAFTSEKHPRDSYV